MAITMLLGVPGSGKSYESVVYQTLPALQAGRKVITNLPLNVDKFAELDPAFPALIELRNPTVDNPRPFSRLDDYQFDWRGPDGGGPLFIIDECHFSLPRGSTPRDIEEWFSMHRHYLVDVILITQSYGKVSKSICELVQNAIVLRKNSTLGHSKSYRRQVRDGLRNSTEVGMSVRWLNEKYYPLYKSHTKSGGGAEAGLMDVKTIWTNWRFYLLGLSLVVILYAAYQGGFDFLFWSGSSKAKAPDKPAVSVSADSAKPAAVTSSRSNEKDAVLRFVGFVNGEPLVSVEGGRAPFAGRVVPLSKLSTNVEGAARACGQILLTAAGRARVEC